MSLFDTLKEKYSQMMNSGVQSLARVASNPTLNVLAQKSPTIETFKQPLLSSYQKYIKSPEGKLFPSYGTQPFPKVLTPEGKINPQALSFGKELGMGVTGSTPSAIVGGGVKATINAQLLKKKLPEIRSIKNMLASNEQLSISQQDVLDRFINRWVPSATKTFLKTINQPQERRKYAESLVAAMEDQALNPGSRIGLSVKDIRKSAQGGLYDTTKVAQQPSVKGGFRPKEMGEAFFIDAKGQAIDVAEHKAEVFGKGDLRVVTTPNELNIETKQGFLPDQINTLKKMFNKILAKNPNAKVIADTPNGSGVFKSVDELVAQQPLSVKKVKPLKVSTEPQIKPMQSSLERVSSEVPQAQIKSKNLLQEAIQKQSKQPVAEALPDILSRDAIDVKSKVGILDAIRTPDRVMKKIGMEKEMNLIRQKYDDYLKQLPEEINKVTEWSKQVPRESSQRIFKYLDGQPIQLEKNELKVAGEIKTYLKNWADKLGLPEDKRITNYITHIFEKDFIKKEFDPELAKLIQDKVAGSVYDPFTQKRLGKLGYVEDTWRALDAYVKRATRKVNMDVALKEVKTKAKDLELSQYNYVKKYIDRINMRPTEVDNAIDNTIKQLVGYKYGQRPVTSITRSARQMIYRGTLGLNPGSALKNLSQGANTYAKLGERYTIKGYWDILTKGTKELNEVGVLRDQFIQDRTISVGKQLLQKFDKGLYAFFDAAEKINRGAAYYGGKAMALARGETEEEAIKQGIKMVRDTQFTFGSIDTPPILSSDIGKLLLQFQSYSIKQGEFLLEMLDKKEFAGLVRYALAGTAFVFSLGKLIGMEPKDLIPTFRIGLPPTIQTPVEIGKAILGSPDKYGNIPNLEERVQNVTKSLIPFVPGGTQIKKTVEGLGTVNKGYSESKTGRIRTPVEQSTASKIRGAIFGQYNLPEMQKYYDEDMKVLGEKQSEIFKELSPEEQKKYFDLIQEKRELEKKKSSGLIEETEAAGGDEYSKLQEEVFKTKFEMSSENTATFGDKVYYKEDGSIKSLPLTPEDNIKELNLTGQEELDKKLTSQYKSSVTRAITKITDLYELGIIDAKEAEERIKKIQETAVKTGTKKAKKITLPKVSLPKIPKPIAIKKIKVKRPTKTVKSMRVSKKKITPKKVNLKAKI